MAQLKRRSIILSSGKHIKLTGVSIAIAPTLEIGEGFTTNILGVFETNEREKGGGKVINPYSLSKEEVYELADYNIRLWMDLKDAIRIHDLHDPDIFRKSGP